MAFHRLGWSTSAMFSDNCDNVDRENLSRADKIIAKQLYSLSFQDRNAINEEIHGVHSMSVRETPELVEASLLLLQTELQILPLRYKLVYDRACTMSMTRNQTTNISSTSQTHPFQQSSSRFCYVKSSEFQLVFLRCEFFNIKKAALRLAKYLELAYDLYGEEALRRPLRMNDLNSKEEVAVLEAGHQQLLPFRDKSGRRVLAIHGDLNLPRSSLMSRSVLSKGPAMKLLLYLWSVLMEDVDAQQRGLVVVFWPRYVDHGISKRDVQKIGKDGIQGQFHVPDGSTSHPSKRALYKQKCRFNISDDMNESTPLIPTVNSRATGKHFFEAVPIRMCSMHFCLPETPFFKMIRHVVLFILGDSYRTRVKAHLGDGTEVAYSLMGYGIPVDTLPLDELSQTVKTKNQAAFVKVRRKIESDQYDYNQEHFFLSPNGIASDESSMRSIDSDISYRSSIIECPSLHDVIFRSGKSYMSHPGNMMFREIIEKHIDEHNAASQDRKKKLTWEVLGEVNLKGGRFLEYDRELGTWTQLSDRSVIRHKIANYFKEYRRKVRAVNQTQTTNSSTSQFEAQDGRKRKRDIPSCK